MTRTQTLTRTAMGTVIIALCAWISIPAAVPFTLQTFGIFLVLAVRQSLSTSCRVLWACRCLPDFPAGRGGAAGPHRRLHCGLCPHRSRLPANRQAASAGAGPLPCGESGRTCRLLWLRHLLVHPGVGCEWQRIQPAGRVGHVCDSLHPAGLHQAGAGPDGGPAAGTGAAACGHHLLIGFRKTRRRPAANDMLPL